MAGLDLAVTYKPVPSPCRRGAMRKINWEREHASRHGAQMWTLAPAPHSPCSSGGSQGASSERCLLCGRKS